MKMLMAIAFTLPDQLVKYNLNKIHQYKYKLFILYPSMKNNHKNRYTSY